MAAILAGGAARGAPLEAYGRLPAVQEIAISPDGAKVATILDDHDKRSIRVETVADHKLLRLVQVGAAIPRGLVWAGADHLVIVAAATGVIENAYAPRREYSAAFDLDLRDGKVYPILGDVPNGINIVLGNPMPRMADGKLALFVPGYYLKNDGAAARLSLYRVDLDKHTSALAWAGFDLTTDIVIDEHGKIVAESEYDSRLGRWTLKVRQGDDWRTVVAVDAKLDPPALLGAGRRAGTVVVQEVTPEGAAFREVSLAEGNWPQPFENADTPTALVWSADHRLVGMRAVGEEGIRYRFYEADDAQVWKVIEAAFPGQQVTRASITDVPGRLVARVDSPTEGPAFALIDTAAKSAVWIGAERPQLSPGDIAPVSAIRFKAADGLDIGGLLTLPAGREPKKLPLIVMPHDGPTGFDTAGFNWRVQALASRGYAVLQVNYRGSGGRDHKFLEAGYGEWGRKTETDLSDGVRFLASQGVIDPARVCIVGFGYGGYSALLGAALEPLTYRCAASIGGLAAFRQWLSDRSDVAKRLWERYIGAQQLTDGVLRPISPWDQASKIVAPVLLIHGEDDTVMPISQSRMMAEALKRAGKSVQFETLKGEDHGLSHDETRLQMLRTLVAFLEKNNPPN